MTERDEPVARLEPIADASDPIALAGPGRPPRDTSLAAVEPLKLTRGPPPSEILDEMRADSS